MISNKLAAWVVIVVTAVWVVSFSVSIVMVVLRNDPLTNSIFLQVNTVFMAIVGGAFAVAIKRRGPGDGGGPAS